MFARKQVVVGVDALHEPLQAVGRGERGEGRCPNSHKAQ